MELEPVAVEIRGPACSAEWGGVAGHCLIFCVGLRMRWICGSRRLPLFSPGEASWVACVQGNFDAEEFLRRDEAGLAHLLDEVAWLEVSGLVLRDGVALAEVAEVAVDVRCHGVEHRTEALESPVLRS